MPNSKTMDEIRKAAEDHGWRVNEGHYTWQFERTVPLVGKMAKMAEAMGFEGREHVRVEWTESGGMQYAVLHTPRDQAALDGHFVSHTQQADHFGKKVTVLAWLSRPVRSYPLQEVSP